MAVGATCGRPLPDKLGFIGLFGIANVGRGLDPAAQLHNLTALKFGTPCRGRYFLVQTRKYPKNLPKGRYEKAPPWESPAATPSSVQKCSDF